MSNPNYENVLKHGVLLKSNTFHTNKGIYVLNFYIHADHLWFIKNLNGKIVEVQDFTKIVQRHCKKQFYKKERNEKNVED